MIWLAGLAGHTNRSFVDENGQAVDMRKEAVEHCLIRQFVNPHALGVLEIGARYGTSSCEISHLLHLPEAVIVSVEADARVWNATEANYRHNSCRNHLVRGVVGHHPMIKHAKRNGSPWTNRFQVAAPSDNPSTAPPDPRAPEVVPAYTPSALAARYHASFDTLVVDCEGCFAAILRDFPDFVRSLQTVMLEGDYGIGLQRQGYVDYNNVTVAMLTMGFMVSEQFFHPDTAKKPNRITMMIFQKVGIAAGGRRRTACSELVAGSEATRAATTQQRVVSTVTLSDRSITRAHECDCSWATHARCKPSRSDHSKCWIECCAHGREIRAPPKSAQRAIR